MTGAERAAGAVLLRQLRESRGWSWSDLARALRDTAHRLAVTSLMHCQVASIQRSVARWESSTDRTRPAERYQFLLAHLYARTPGGDLALDPGSDFDTLLDALRHFGVPPLRVRQLVTLITQSSTSDGSELLNLRSSGTHPGVVALLADLLCSNHELALRPNLQPGPVIADLVMSEQLVDAVVRKVMLVLQGGNDEFDQNLFLKGVLSASLAPFAALGVAVPADVEVLDNQRGARLDPRAVDVYSEIVASHRNLYWSYPARDLLPSAVAHAQLGAGMIRSAVGTEETLQRLAAAVSESALLAARLAFFDLAQPDTAIWAFRLAHTAVEVSQDHALIAAVFAHRAFVPGFAGDARPARDLLRAAHAHACYDSGPLLRSWLYCVDAEIMARTGQAEAGLACIRSAEDALTTGGIDPEWLDFFDPSRLAGFAGNALLLAKNHDEAAGRLTQSLDELPSEATKQQAVLLLDLATAQAATDAEQALATAHQACDLLNNDPYATAVQRLQQVQEALGATRYAAELAERARGVVGAIES